MQPILATSAAAVTPHDSNPNVFNALFIGGAGNVKVVTKNGETVTFVGCAAGSILPVATTVVFATDTTATSIVGLKW
jgi:hypothetical protein